MNETSLRQLLDDVSRGAVTVEQATLRLRDLPYENLGYARIDHHRALRKAAPEVVFCEARRLNKPPKFSCASSRNLVEH